MGTVREKISKKTVPLNSRKCRMYGKTERRKRLFPERKTVRIKQSEFKRPNMTIKSVNNIPMIVSSSELRSTVKF